MKTLEALLKFEVVGFVVALALIVAIQLLTGQINTKGLLNEKVGRKTISPARIQLLAITVGTALYYLTLVTAQPESTPSNSLPDLPPELLLLLGGSNVAYLSTKSFVAQATKNSVTPE
jgi:hypothetical protein